MARDDQFDDRFDDRDEPVAGRKRRWPRRLVITVVTILLLLVVIDRVGVIVADRTVASQASKQLGSEGVTSSGAPSVDIHGFPFVTQVISGKYGRIDISLAHPATRGVRLDSLDVTASNVTAPLNSIISGHGTVTAATVHGTGHLGWASFTQLLSLSGVNQYGIDPSTITISGTDSGHVNLSTPISMLGLTFNALATGNITVSDNVVHVRIVDVSAADGILPANVAAQLSTLGQQMTFDVPIPTLPYHMVIDGVTTTAKGVTVTASAHNVVLGS